MQDNLIFIAILLLLLILIVITVSIMWANSTKNKVKETALLAEISALKNTITTQKTEQQQQIKASIAENLLQVQQHLQTEQHQSRQAMQQSINALSQQLTEHRQHQQQNLSQQQNQQSNALQDITKQLQAVKNTNQQILQFAGQMQSLERILQHPKQRGILGEYYLEQMLANILPPNLFAMQHKFSNGTIVDAAIFMRTKVIPIDSKFSLANYNKLIHTQDASKKKQIDKLLQRDFKNRINETAKYIQPQHNTTTFAFMYIPAEGVYYKMLQYKDGKDDLMVYAFNKRVIPVSPTSFYAYLETVLQGLKALKIEQSVKEVQKNIALLQKHLESYDNHFERLGKQISTVVNTYNQTDKERRKIDRDVHKINDGSIKNTGQYTLTPIERPIITQQE